MIGCRFSRCNLRQSALGGMDLLLDVKQPNRFIDVEFEKSDLRGSAHTCETYTHCRFSRCRLDSVQFMASVFEECVFVGRMKAVEFRATIPRCEDMPHNRLLRCDFREADLIECQFICIDLDPAMFRPNKDWIFLPRGPRDLIDLHAAMTKPNFFIQSAIEIAGTPSFICRSDLDEVGLTKDEIERLVNITKRKPD